MPYLAPWVSNDSPLVVASKRFRLLTRFGVAMQVLVVEMTQKRVKTHQPAPPSQLVVWATQVELPKTTRSGSLLGRATPLLYDEMLHPSYCTIR